MPHIQPNEIQAALKTGKPVWSHAIGRFGRITEVDGNLVFGQGGRKGRGAKWVTTFHRPQGDDVRLIETDEKWIIQNTPVDNP